MKSPKQKATNLLDVVFSKYIRLRDTNDGYGVCCSCGKPTLYGNGDAGHFINRRWMTTRWREDNVHFQCRSCNRFDEGNAAGYSLFMIRTYGQPHVEYLHVLSKDIAKFTVPEIELLAADYRRKIKELNKDMV